MKEQILSVGIDLGTSTTQIVFSRLTVVNTASAFSVPSMEISDREIIFRSSVYFTPLLSEDTLDAAGIRRIIGEEYERAGIEPSDVQTGAVIITGETARKENAKAVLEAIKDFAGRFVVATAGPALESILAARGAGADCYAKEHGTNVLHLDIGGGTTNFALFDREGNLVDTGCVNIGGRLVKFDTDGKVTYRSPVLNGVDTVSVGQQANLSCLNALTDVLVQVLEEAAGLRQRSQVYSFITDRLIDLPKERILLSFSGGVAALMERDEKDWRKFGDLGILLAEAIKKSRLCQGDYILGKETVQATVVGAGAYSTELSGSTVDHHKVEFPLQDLPVVALTAEEETLDPEKLSGIIKKKLQPVRENPAVLALHGSRRLTYDNLQKLADGICRGCANCKPPLVIVVQEDMAKALGQAVRGQLGRNWPVVCLDGIAPPDGSFLDIAAPVGDGAAIPVVIKTLAFM